MKLVLFCAAVLCVAASYPTTFPFENESFIPVKTPAGTPNLTYEVETDSGGYIYYYYARASFTLTEEDWEAPTLLGEDVDAPWSPTQCGAIRYLLVQQFGAPPDLPADVWNCTAKDQVFSNGDFTGVVNAQTVCDVGSCCLDVIGQIKFSDDQLNWHTVLADRAASAVCGDITEEMYCIVVGGDYQTNCFEYYLSPGERLVTFPCNDSWSLYYLSCPVYLQAYAPVYAAFEPPSYYDAITEEEKIASDAEYFLGDRVCNPYSYYHPDSKKADGASADGASADGASAASTDAGGSEGSDSSATTVSGALMFVFATIV